MNPLRGQPPAALSLASWLDARASIAAPALIDRGRAVGFTALFDEAARVAGGLSGLGVGPGDRVAVWMPNTPAWLAVFFACARLGAIVVSVNTRFRSAEVADILQRSRARVVVYWPGFRGIDFPAILAACDPPALAGLESVVAYGEDDVTRTPALPVASPPRVLAYRDLAAHAPQQLDAGRPDAGCVIFTTSGTTRAPKFVVLSQQAVIAHAADVARGFALGADAVMLLAPPLCGVFGFCCAMAAIAAGRPLVMRPAWNAEDASRDTRRFAVTHANATDEAIAQLLQCVDTSPAYPTARVFGVAAFTPALGDIAERAHRRGLSLVGLYGASEIQALFARQDDALPIAERSLAGGRPVDPSARVRARDPESGECCPHGTPGELEFFAPHSRMIGYDGNAEATADAVTADGFYRSGDLGYTLPDGRFVFLSRIGDSLRLGGFLVSPLEIEAELQAAPEITGAQVVGIAGEAGLIPVAFVTLAPGAVLDEAATRTRLQGRLARFKIPQRVFAIESFPVTPGANATKIQKGRLRDIAAARLRSERLR